MDADSFEEYVTEALELLPEEFRELMDNVDVVVEEWPDRETMRLAHVRHPSRLLGFYHGVPRTQRTHDYYLVMPDKISIYRQPILLHCRTAEEARDMVHHVVRHEIAHHFGISDERLWEIGAY
jgi:predicted Zn-dependent protease with MMP-like domain